MGSSTEQSSTTAPSKTFDVAWLKSVWEVVSIISNKYGFGLVLFLGLGYYTDRLLITPLVQSHINYLEDTRESHHRVVDLLQEQTNELRELNTMMRWVVPGKIASSDE